MMSAPTYFLDSGNYFRCLPVHGLPSATIPSVAAVCSVLPRTVVNIVVPPLLTDEAL